jgi:prolyl-tRNA editing enzyme YbaK/EbsC (Cys-tRNA(Pro) deacylase)
VSLFEGAREFPAGTRTAQDAAAAIGCDVGQIVKSLVFVRSGANTVDAERLGLAKADADVVRRATGFAIGGVPPYGHPAPLETLIDEDLLGYDEVWAAAGTPRSVFPLTPAQLVARAGGTVARVSPAS